MIDKHQGHRYTPSMANSREVARDAAEEAWRSMADLFVEGEHRDAMERVCAELQVSPGMLKALVDLGVVGEAKMGELATHWHCDASYVTAIADGLQDRGLVERRAHPTDRRVKVLGLTPRGVEVREHALATLHEPPDAFAVLNASELRQLRDLLRKLTAADRQLRERASRGATDEP
jgi:DNA-binding MarR family transcriptional regulator